MKLKSIDIKNFKSIESLKIPIEEVNGSYTYGLIGVNEAGKSAILKVISMMDNFKDANLSADDFHNGADRIEVYFNYEIDKKLLESEDFTDFKDNQISTGFEVLKSNPKHQELKFKYNGKLGEEKSEEIAKSNPYKSITDERHKIVLWSYDTKYLLDKEIVLNQTPVRQPQRAGQTQSNPIAQTIKQNVPLNNCFAIADIDVGDFQKNINNSVERKSYEKKLKESVNELIKKRWPNQNIEIEFDLTETKINFHIVEKNAPKAQRLNQRSDGFRQFLSFLLSIGAESASENLTNTIILLDEPETHLHPQAQIFFLDEIINLTNSNNNILFYSTHSGFLIDKNNIDRTARVTKGEETQKTDITFLEKDHYSFARVNYEIFEAEAEGYHNELYDKLRDVFAKKNGTCDLGIKNFDEQFFKQEKKQAKSYPEKGKKNQVTLPTFVRNCIHYPSNKNGKFEEYLKKSIQLLIEWTNDEK